VGVRGRKGKKRKDSQVVEGEGKGKPCIVVALAGSPLRQVL
jgi:hypothetical protein